jgi:hypothetical protein
MTTLRTGTRAAATAAPLSLPRLYLLRVGYLVLGVGLAVTKWPLFLHHEPWSLTQGVVNCLLLALSLLALVGLRHPVRMLPILLFEAAWKLIWLAVVALPLWTSGQVDQAAQDLIFACLWVVIILVAIPWRFVFEHYVAERGERWRSTTSSPTARRI